MTPKITPDYAMSKLDEALDFLAHSGVGGEARDRMLAMSQAASNYVVAASAIRHAEALEANTAAMLQLIDLLRVQSAETRGTGLDAVDAALAAANRSKAAK